MAHHTTRTIGQKLADAWGKPFVVDKRAGAGGIIGTEIAARAAPEGYTLLLATSSGLIVIPLLNPKLPYDSFRDFAPVGLCATNPTLLVVHPAVPVTSVKELIVRRQGAGEHARRDAALHARGIRARKVIASAGIKLE